eukprot:CAMPEP_0117678430 /NCGR_PEP_ID=MMETSP0804-20121206/17293_1 /TAXON_ID=1074897 /ORGANISM="Tetraselmis astigmatica, Strain CCMP880" /LENGTH=112 /DNA_ID=CAMNT_0005487817 /DNA_START=75 /DNA_END=413 /DNA_ORIENTATION=+
MASAGGGQQQEMESKALPTLSMRAYEGGPPFPPGAFLLRTLALLAMLAFFLLLGVRPSRVGESAGFPCGGGAGSRVGVLDGCSTAGCFFLASLAGTEAPSPHPLGTAPLTNR